MSGYNDKMVLVVNKEVFNALVYYIKAMTKVLSFMVEFPNGEMKVKAQFTEIGEAFEEMIVQAMKAKLGYERAKYFASRDEQDSLEAKDEMP